MKNSSLALLLSIAVFVLSFVLCIFIVRSEVTRVKIEILEQRIEDKQEISQVQIADLKDRIDWLIDRG